MSGKCKDCTNFHPEDSSKFPAGYGYCRRFPPTVIYESKAGSGLEVSHVWPVVSRILDCGEFKIRGLEAEDD